MAPVSLFDRTHVCRALRYIFSSKTLYDQGVREKPNLYIFQLIMDSKRDEFINIYSQAAGMDKTKAVNMLKEIDPSKAAQYDRIMKQGP
jgi:hypothetical protein